VARTDELRLMAKVANLYYEQKLRQTDIAARLDLSQATVSRLLKRAQDENIVRISVSTPLGCFPDLERALAARYSLTMLIMEGTYLSHRLGCEVTPEGVKAGSRSTAAKVQGPYGGEC
jgi:DNA-binding transcriptional regulator LsrR (DeoR family)